MSDIPHCPSCTCGESYYLQHALSKQPALNLGYAWFEEHVVPRKGPFPRVGETVYVDGREYTVIHVFHADDERRMPTVRVK